MEVVPVALADDETHEGLDRVVAAKEMVASGDEVRLRLDGGGTVWPGARHRPPRHHLLTGTAGAGRRTRGTVHG